MTTHNHDAATPERPDAAEPTDDGRRLGRRRYLAGACGIVGAAATSGCASFRGLLRDGDGPDARTDDPGPVVRTGDRTDFIWLTAGVYRRDRMYENILAYARRHDLAVIVSRASTVYESADAIRAPLAAAAERDVTAWLATGCFRDDFTAGDIANDEDAREEHLARLAAIVEAYEEFSPGGTVICWHEEPLVSHWIEGGGWTERAVQNMERLGPDVFAAQKRAIREVNDDIDAGIFVHNPYIVDDDVFSSITADLADRNALPDFTFTDYYRGYTEPEEGYEAANDHTRALVTNAREHTDGRPVYNLGEDHTINTNYTPSTAAIRGHLRAALAAGVDGLGWYVRSRYRRTALGFDPFLPNQGDVSDEALFSTFTGSRDRFQYAYRTSLETLSGFDPEERFDLWIEGDDLAHYEHRLELKTADGKWEFVGDLYGYVAGDNPYSGEGRTSVSIVHALDRGRFPADDLELRLTTDPDGDGATLRSVSALPYDTGAYVTEREAASILADAGDFGEYAFGHRPVDGALRAGDSRELTLAFEGDPTSLRKLRFPDHLDELEALAAAESADGFDPTGAFDVWIAGDGIEPDDVYVEYNGERLFLAEESATAAATGMAAAFYGIDRERRPEVEAGIAGTTADATLDALYAMPYFGSDDFRTPARVAELVETDDFLPTFCLHHRSL